MVKASLTRHLVTASEYVLFSNMSNEFGSDENAFRPVFSGDGRRLFCRDVSGQDCDRIMGSDAVDCGIDSHVRIVPIGALFGDARFRTRSSVHRRRIIVDEEYEIFFDDTDLHLDFDKNIFDPSDLWVATKVQQEFTAYHSCSADEAIANIRLLVEKSIGNGRYRKLDWGGHCFTWRGYLAVVTPNLKTVVRYKTSHYERTPKQVAEGVKSRLSKRRSQNRPIGEIPESMTVGTICDGVVSSISNLGLFVRVAENLNGLLHRSHLENFSHGPECLFEVGQKIQVEVISIDRELNRVAIRQVNGPMSEAKTEST
jgi:hypothetical protein